MHHTISLLVISGFEDGNEFKLSSMKGDGKIQTDRWTILVGRLDHCDVRLIYDSFISREHAKIHFSNNGWWLEDLNSRNGTFVPLANNFFEDERVASIRTIEPNQIFRVGRTWLRLKQIE